MAELYADENFSHRVVDVLRTLGHDVLTARDAGQAGQGIDDPDVLKFATARGRAVLTLNRGHFIRLHRKSPRMPASSLARTTKTLPLWRAEFMLRSKPTSRWPASFCASFALGSMDA